jgi:hypothetical protein
MSAEFPTMHNSILVFLRLRVTPRRAREGRNGESGVAWQRQIFELICMTISSARPNLRKTLRTHQPRIQSRRKFMAEFTVGRTEFIYESR